MIYMVPILKNLVFILKFSFFFIIPVIVVTEIWLPGPLSVKYLAMSASRTFHEWLCFYDMY